MSRNAALRSIVLLALCAACSKRPAPATGGLDCAIEDRAVVIGARRLVVGAPLDPWKAALGEPSRFVDRAGGIYVWDDLGIFVTLGTSYRADDPHVMGVWWVFAEGSSDFWPKSTFRGTLAARGKPIDARTKASDARATQYAQRETLPVWTMEPRTRPAPHGDELEAYLVTAELMPWTPPPAGDR